MRVLVSGSTTTLRRMLPAHPGRLGVLLTPANGNRVGWWPPGTPWACDNGCFNGLDVPAWFRFLAKLAASEDKPAWVACPDAVGDMRRTWGLYDVWSPVLRAVGLPVALVLQDGVDRLNNRAFLPQEWDRIAAVFVGGSTAFKTLDSTHAVCREAKDRGKWVHVGRVNTRNRVERIVAAARRHGYEIDSIDGGTAVFGDTNLPKLLRWIGTARQQRVMFGGLA